MDDLPATVPGNATTEVCLSWPRRRLKPAQPIGTPRHRLPDSFHSAPSLVRLVVAIALR